MSRLFYCPSQDSHGIRIRHHRSNRSRVRMTLAFERNLFHMKQHFVPRGTTFRYTNKIFFPGWNSASSHLVQLSACRHLVQLSACRHFVQLSARRHSVRTATRSRNEFVVQDRWDRLKSRNSSDQPSAVSSCHNRASGIPTTLK